MQSKWWGYTRMLPTHVANIIIICNIVSILTIFFGKYFVFSHGLCRQCNFAPINQQGNNYGSNFSNRIAELYLPPPGIR